VNATLLAIDPGPEQSAYVVTNGARIEGFGIEPNEDLLVSIYREQFDVRHVAIEGIACYGMPVGRETFDTCIWIGRFIEAVEAGTPAHASLVYRKDVKLHLCQSVRAKDPMVRQAILDRFGPGKDKAIGTKRQPGPLYGIKSHCWSALAVALTFCDTKIEPTAAAG
jgi:hypothetical protein